MQKITIKLTDGEQFNKANELISDFMKREGDLCDAFNLFQKSLDAWQYECEQEFDDDEEDAELNDFESMLLGMLRIKGIAHELEID